MPPFSDVLFSTDHLVPDFSGSWSHGGSTYPPQRASLPTENGMEKACERSRARNPGVHVAFTSFLETLDCQCHIPIISQGCSNECSYPLVDGCP